MAGNGNPLARASKETRKVLRGGDWFENESPHPNRDLWRAVLATTAVKATTRANCAGK